MSGRNEPHHQGAAAAATPTASEPEAPKAAASSELAKTAEPEPAAPESTPAPEAPDAAAAQAAAPDTEPAATATAEAEAEAEPEADSAASGKSTAPRPSGRPSRGLLAGAAIAGALLVGVPFLVSGALDRSGPGNGGPADRVADAGTVLNDSGNGAAPGVYGSADPAPSSPSPSPSAGKGKEDDGKHEPKTGAVVGGPAVPRSTQEAPKNPEPSKTPQKPKKKTPPKPAVTTTVTAAPGTTLFGHASNRCIEMVAHKGADGSPLQIANCTGKNWQKWDFRPDGTIRSMGLCMDVAWGSHDNGAVIQIAWCSGNPAQQFVLSADHDLVNPQANKCVDVKNAQTGGGARLQLWDCNGQDNQKWSRR
ncbi:ricin-type beta-trefoil lectin domain protein [Streptomyces castrisilvae]|uniref:Ricin-type beta-trefoil lectin domain protein n=1 Tax=Streptomyces castrisilvae TaxID=3033811 RepID=A0ABY9HRT2_9ACTN|nr:RICIN domain-containing protein [Streptomyces sp. Mut1]WLQ37267.1 ricin-type beta-trefoil lectin domain protein [Streptomyces sp. Mut1]